VKTLITLLSAVVFCGLKAMALAAALTTSQPLNQPPNPAAQTLPKNQTAASKPTVKKDSKLKPGATPSAKKTVKTLKGNIPLSPKTPKVVVQLYKTDLKTQTKHMTQYQKDVTEASALMGQVKNGQPTAAQVQALKKFKAQIIADQARDKTDKQTMAKDLDTVKATAAQLKAQAGKGQPVTAPKSASVGQTQDKMGSTANSQSAAANPISQKTQSNSSQVGFDIQNLVQIVNDATTQAKPKVSAVATAGANISIGDMFQMQMLRNHLSQMSEMSTSVINASNSSVNSMSRNISR